VIVGKAWCCTSREDESFTAVVYAETRSKARYSFFLKTDGFNFIESVLRVSVRRCKDADLLAPIPMDVVEELSEDEKHIIAHSHGNDSDTPGYRSYYNVSSLDEPPLNRLVLLGLMNAPYRSSCGGSWYYTLTRLGCLAAMSLLPIKRSDLSFVIKSRQEVLGMLDVVDLDLKNELGVSLVLLKVNPKLISQISDLDVLIYSGEWGGYWRSGGSGYTYHKSEAGVYDFKDAYKRSGHCGDEKAIYYCVG
jgi:hypothetical protein